MGILFWTVILLVYLFLYIKFKKFANSNSRTMSFRRFFIIMVLSVMFSVWVFNPFEKIPLESPDNGTQIMSTLPIEIDEIDGRIFYIDIDSINKPSFKNSIRNLFSVPFDFKHYNLYLESPTLTLFFIDGYKINVSYNELFLILNGEPINISNNLRGKLPIEIIPSDRNNTFKLKGNYYTPKHITSISDEGYEISEVMIIDNSLLFAKPIWHQVLIKIFLMIFSLWALILLLFNIFELLMPKKALSNQKT